MALSALPILLPLLASALLVATTSLGLRRVADAVALATAAAVAVLCAFLLERASDAPVVSWAGGWTPRDGVAIGIDLYADRLAAALACFAAVLTVASLVASLRLRETAGHLYHALVLVFLAGMIGFCLAGDLFTAFVFFELMSVASFGLTGLLVDRRSPVEGALNFAVTNTVGSVLLLVGIALLYGETGALNMAQVGAALEGGAPAAVALSLIAAGFLVKAAIVPFHFWLADTYAAAPIAICVLFAGAMSELGLYGLARTYWTVFAGPLEPHAELLRAVLLALGAATAVVGALMALAQRLLKRLLAFATVSHMGVLMVGVALLDPQALGGVAIYIVGDGLVKAGLFLAAGALIERHGTGDIGALRGRGRDQRALGALFALGALALAGLPPTGPFLGRAIVEHAGSATHDLWWLPAVLLFAGAVTGAAVLRAAGAIFLGRATVTEAAAGEREAGAEAEEPGPGGIALWLPATALVGLGTVWGLVPGLAAAAAEAAAAFTDRAGYIAVVLHGTGMPGAPVDAASADATAWALGLASCGLALALSLPARLPAVPPALRALHSGRVGDYLAWLAAGTAALSLAFWLGLT
jgi:multicomponent Na+:H+ antiporter subunit D